MAFVRRLLGGVDRPEERADSWFDVPPVGSFEVAGVAHHKQDIAKVIPPVRGEPETLEVPAMLRRDPANDFDPNAVGVLISGQLVGYVPRGSAEAWSNFLMRLEREGLVARASARVWVGENAWFVTVHARPNADYRTPIEEAVHQQERARSEAAQAAKRAKREAARSERAESARLAKERRGQGVCVACGGAIEHEPGKRGRPAIYCTSCRALGVRVQASKTAITQEGARATPERPTPEPPRPAEPPVVWMRSASPTDWAVVDVETTGLSPRYDRVVEVAVVRLSAGGEEIETWTTLVDPERDMSAARFNGLSAADVRGAPTFAQIMPDILGRISGARLAAHNARFDLSFLQAEIGRSGMTWEGASALCTMAVPYQLGMVTSRRLEDCCEELHIALPGERSAAGNAQASAAILRTTLKRMGQIDFFTAAPIAPSWPSPVPPGGIRSRTDLPPPRMPTALAHLASRVEVAPTDDLPVDGALSYLELLDRVLEDRQVTDEEVDALSMVAEEWHLPAAGIRRLHSTYLHGVWDLARADGVVTEAERRDLGILTELLGVSVDEAEAEPTAPSAPRREDLVGMSVCFTGDSVCTIRGAFLSRHDQEALAKQAGLNVKSGVSSKLDILVLADPDSKSGKARKADDLGVRKMAEPVFWRTLGVRID
jgi:DNA polymerase-3 subunit epsilon